MDGRKIDLSLQMLIDIKNVWPGGIKALCLQWMIDKSVWLVDIGADPDVFTECCRARNEWQGGKEDQTQL